MPCVFCAFERCKCKGICPTRILTRDNGFAVTDFKPLTDYFGKKYVKHCFVNAAQHKPSITIEEFEYIKRGLVWELSCWNANSTYGPYIKCCIPTLEDVGDLEIGDMPSPNKEDVGDLDIGDMPSPNKSLLYDEGDFEDLKLPTVADIVAHIKCLLVEELFFLSTTFGQSEIEKLVKKEKEKLVDLVGDEQIKVVCLAWCVKMWNDHPLGGPLSVYHALPIGMQDPEDPESGNHGGGQDGEDPEAGNHGAGQDGQDQAGNHGAGQDGQDQAGDLGAGQDGQDQAGER